MHARREAARHQQGVAGELPQDAGRVALPATARTRRPPSVPSTVDPGSTEMGAASGLRQLARGLGAQVGDGDDDRSGGVQVEGGLVGRIIRGHDHDALPDPGPVAIEIGLRGACEKDAGAIVAREHQWPLDGAGREHHAARAHLPEPFTR